MVTGPLFVVGLACFFFGLYRACTGAVRFEVREDWALAALGAAAMGAAVALWVRGLA